MVCLEYCLFDRRPNSGCFDYDKEWSNRLPRRAGLEWSVSLTWDGMALRALACYHQVTKEWVAGMKPC